jgi:uncharacterized protein YndB with AHSA1/START domain
LWIADARAAYADGRDSTLAVGGAVIEWRMHLATPLGRVYDFLATASGRERFWAESAPERDGVIEFAFPGGMHWRSRVLAAEPPHRFALNYYGDTEVLFTLDDDGRGGCDLTLRDSADDAETRAGWVSVLLTLKAAADFDVDLRNHDPSRTWNEGYADN